MFWSIHTGTSSFPAWLEFQTYQVLYTAPAHIAVVFLARRCPAPVENGRLRAAVVTGDTYGTYGGTVQYFPSDAFPPPYRPAAVQLNLNTGALSGWKAIKYIIY